MSLELGMEKVKRIPDKFKMIVSGYMHEMESILHSSNDSAYYNIPDLVVLTVLCFYYNIMQFTKWSDSITISGKDNNIAILSPHLLQRRSKPAFRFR